MAGSATTDPTPGLRYATAAGRWVLAATVLGSGIAALDATVVGIALPAIARDFHASVSSTQWVVDGYTLPLAGLLLLGGALGDAFGRRKVFVIGTIWFAIASLACGLAPNAGFLIVARAVQGRAPRCSSPAAWRSSRRRSRNRTARGPSAPGPGSAASPPRSGRSSAAG